MTVEELFGTLQQAVVGSWRKHLRTAKYGKHEALDEFYKEMPEKVDALIEAWMGANGKKIGEFDNLLKSANYNTLSYLKELKKICKQGYSILGDNDELKSLLDDIVNLINSTLYKVKELSESSVIDLKDYLNEALINEGPSTPSSIYDLDRSEVIAELDEVLFASKKIQDKTLRAYKTMPLENVLDKFDLWDELSKRLYGFDKESIRTYLDRNREDLDEYFYDNYNL